MASCIIARTVGCEKYPKPCKELKMKEVEGIIINENLLDFYPISNEIVLNVEVASICTEYNTNLKDRFFKY